MTPLQLVKQRREINMRIVLLGATGFVGSALLVEALHRGHKVTAIARHPEKLEKETVSRRRRAMSTIQFSCITHRWP